MSQKLLIDGSRESQTQVALLSEGGLEDFEFESSSKRNLKGNIYLGKVSRIEASLQAAFIDIGAEKNGFLAFGEIHPNYFQIPVADREALIEAEAEVENEQNIENEINDNVTDQQNNLDDNIGFGSSKAYPSSDNVPPGCFAYRSNSYPNPTHYIFNTDLTSTHACSSTYKCICKNEDSQYNYGGGGAINNAKFQ